MSFENNVFINCPFDSSYRPLLRALFFCILYLEHEPKLSETKSSSDVRIDKIKNLIKNSKFSIHDISKSVASKKGDIARFNMPFELGLDIGCKEYGISKHHRKKTLILDSAGHLYDISLSDISGQDIETHNNDRRTLIGVVRDWFSRNYPLKILPSTRSIWIAYNQFSVWLAKNLRGDYTKREIEEMQPSDYARYVKDWIAEFQI